MSDGDFWKNAPDLGLPESRQPDPEDGNCVVWQRPRCPFCNSADTQVTNSNHIPYRYHKCRGCGRNFTSFESNYSPN